MRWRLPIGFLFAPIVPAIAVALVMEWLQAVNRESSLNWDGVWSGFVMILIVAELLTVVVAVPLFFLVRRYRKVGLGECLAAGLIIGLLVGPAGIITGALSAVVFWLLAVRPFTSDRNKSRESDKQSVRNSVN